MQTNCRTCYHARLACASVLAIVLTSSAAAQASGENAAQALTRRELSPARDLSRDKALYCVGYAHLDTQWRWDFPITIDQYIHDTLVQNFERFEQFPEYTFNFTGSARYEMMKEYYPDLYERLKGYIDEGRWFVSGSSVDEGDVNVPSPESIIRQVLYGNLFFRREFGRESVDFMLPDCFGFPASMPSIWAHCGLLGFSTQKLTWGSAVGIPFQIGVWEGPDGNGVLAALDPGAYVGAVEGRVDRNLGWAERINANGRRFGVFADYHYYGVGDRGGAPREVDVRNYIESMGRDDSLFEVILAASDQFYKDVTPAQREHLPRYRGDMLLTEHSAGTLTSQSYMKRWNRKCEQLADAAERAAAAAHHYGGAPYPRAKLERAWVRFLANQMHDILPGTSIPKAYTWSWNDEVVAMNLLAEVLRDSVASWSLVLDTDVQGVPLVVYNPLAIERRDLVEATVPFAGVEHVRVFAPDGHEAPSQLLERRADSVRVLFSADVPSVSLAVFEVRASETPYSDPDSSLRVSDHSLASDRYRVHIDEQGDVASIYDQSLERELLAAPHRLIFTHESPRQYPAWTMDWDDRQQAPVGAVEGPVRLRVVEDGPLRVALEITREQRKSIFEQTISLTHGGADEFVRIEARIDWQTTGGALKASFPLTASNPMATYNWELGTIQRGNNDPKKYEVPSHEWLDLTDESGQFGVTILEDSKFGSDKPSDNELRLTLLYSPEVGGSFQDQHSQDWGRHEMTYALAAHTGDWREGHSSQLGRRLNQPLRVFRSPKHRGPHGRMTSFLTLDSARADVRAVKLAEDRNEIIIRLQELEGTGIDQVRLRIAGGIRQATEVDGQERELGPAEVREGDLVTSLGASAPRAFALRLAEEQLEHARVRSIPVSLPFDTDVVSSDSNRADGAMDPLGRTIPAEMLPREIIAEGIRFELGPTEDGAANAVACRGQGIPLPEAEGNRVMLLAAAGVDEDVTAPFKVGTLAKNLNIQSWTGFVGQWDNRLWETEPPAEFFSWDGRVIGIEPGFIKRDPIAWFATHRHHPDLGNEAYRFSYLFKYELERPDGAQTLILPDDPRIKILAVSVVALPHAGVAPAAPLYDVLSADDLVDFRFTYPPEPEPVYSGLAARGRAVTERADSLSSLVIGQPSLHDLAGALRERGLGFRAIEVDGRFPPHPRAGAQGDRLPRLNDGEAARHDDDTDRCVWFDQEGRFVLDLGATREIARVDTFSWHVSERAPQHFSLWGARADQLPGAGFALGDHAPWELLGVVDTRGLGDGGVHASSIIGLAGQGLGSWRFLLWIAEDMGNGTFFMEIDVHEAE